MTFFFASLLTNTRIPLFNPSLSAKNASCRLIFSSNVSPGDNRMSLFYHEHVHFYDTYLCKAEQNGTIDPTLMIP